MHEKHLHDPFGTAENYTIVIFATAAAAGIKRQDNVGATKLGIHRHR